MCDWPNRLLVLLALLALSSASAGCATQSRWTGDDARLALMESVDLDLLGETLAERGCSIDHEAATFKVAAQSPVAAMIVDASCADGRTAVVAGLAVIEPETGTPIIDVAAAVTDSSVEGLDLSLLIVSDGAVVSQPVDEELMEELLETEQRWRDYLAEHDHGLPADVGHSREAQLDSNRGYNPTVCTNALMRTRFWFGGASSSACCQCQSDITACVADEYEGPQTPEEELESRHDLPLTPRYAAPLWWADDLGGEDWIIDLIGLLPQRLTDWVYYSTKSDNIPDPEPRGTPASYWAVARNNWRWAERRFNGPYPEQAAQLYCFDIGACDRLPQCVTAGATQQLATELVCSVEAIPAEGEELACLEEELRYKPVFLESQLGHVRAEDVCYNDRPVQGSPAEMGSALPSTGTCIWLPQVQD